MSLVSGGSTVTITTPTGTHVNLEATLTQEQLTDVSVTSISNGQVLAWNSSSSKWVNSNVRSLPTGATYQSYDQMVEADGPSLYFPLSDATNPAVDLMYGAAMVATGTPTVLTASLLFDGSKSTTFSSTGNYDGYPFTPGLTSGTPWSFECWLKYPTLPGSQASVFSLDPSGNNMYALVVSSAGVVTFVFQNVAAHAVYTLSAATVYHFAFCYNAGSLPGGSGGGKTWFFHVNGAQVASGTDTPSGSSGQPFLAHGNGATGQGVLMQKAAFYWGKCIPTVRFNAHYVGGTTGVYN